MTPSTGVTPVAAAVPTWIFQLGAVSVGADEIVKVIVSSDLT